MPFFDKVLDILGGSFVGKVLDKIPDAGERQKAQLELEKELNRAAAEIASAQLEEKKIYLEDTQNARAMQQTALGQEDKFSKRFIYYLTAFIIVFGMAYIFWVTFGEVPRANQRMADTVLGFLLGTMIASILNYFYGSTKSSNEKTNQIVSLASQQGTGSGQQVTVESQGTSKATIKSATKPDTGTKE